MSFWTDERVTILRACLADGRTARQIGDELGCSRCAVLGKMERMRRAGADPAVSTVSVRNGSVVTTRVRRRRDPDQQVVMIDDLLAAPRPETGRLLYDHDLRRGHCRWLLPGRAWVFCAEPVKKASSYCAEHHARVFVPYRRDQA